MPTAVLTPLVTNMVPSIYMCSVSPNPYPQHHNFIHQILQHYRGLPCTAWRADRPVQTRRHCRESSCKLSKRLRVSWGSRRARPANLQDLTLPASGRVFMCPHDRLNSSKQSETMNSWQHQVVNCHVRQRDLVKLQVSCLAILPGTPNAGLSPASSRTTGCINR